MNIQLSPLKTTMRIANAANVVSMWKHEKREVGTFLGNPKQIDGNELKRSRNLLNRSLLCQWHDECISCQLSLQRVLIIHNNGFNSKCTYAVSKLCMTSILEWLTLLKYKYSTNSNNMDEWKSLQNLSLFSRIRFIL